MKRLESLMFFNNIKTFFTRSVILSTSMMAFLNVATCNLTFGKVYKFIKKLNQQILFLVNSLERFRVPIEERGYFSK